jgi:squalene-hopene/tetraprenyl-beta-curcumene cyclase
VRQLITGSVSQRLADVLAGRQHQVADVAERELSARFKRTLRDDSRVWFATGDYLAQLTTNSSLCSGEQVAECLRAFLQNGKKGKPMRVRRTLSSSALWPASEFPADRLISASNGLSGRLGQYVDFKGAVRAACNSRVLESALLLRLMERRGHVSTARSGLVNYLHSEQNAADPWDRLLAGAALRHRLAPDHNITDTLIARTPEFTNARKRALLDGFVALLGGPIPASFPVAGIDVTTDLHPWAAVQMTALHVILAGLRGALDAVHANQVELLLATQRTPWIWEGNVLLHLSALHALSFLPDMERVVDDGITKALGQQRRDGGVPFITDADTWCTATAGVALVAVGTPRELVDPLAEHLANQQRPDGGWAYTDVARQTDVDDVSVTLEFLHSVDPHKYADAIEGGLRMLRSVRDPAGGFPTYIVGAPAEACMTAAAINALSIDRNQHQEVIARAIEFLSGAQRPDGSFDPDWSASRWHTVFRALLAASRSHKTRSPAARRLATRALAALRANQNQDGGWGQQPGEPSDAISTSYGLIALCQGRDHRPAVRAANYLLGAQRENGGIASIPDSIGPRPFIFSIPALADIFGLLALGHLNVRLGLHCTNARL